MKKTMIITLTLLMLITASAFAEESKSDTSKADISFIVETPTKPTDPRDPQDPTKPLTPEEEGTGNIGLLTIDYVPDFTFGTQKITRDYEIYESKNPKPFVQVTDTRATGAGWKLQASLDEFKHENEVDTLSNAGIILRNPKVTSFNGNGFDPIPSHDTFILAGDANPTDIMTAEKDSGMGIWLISWLSVNDDTNENVLMTLDTKDARTGSYTSTLTWTLNQTP